MPINEEVIWDGAGAQSSNPYVTLKLGGRPATVHVDIADLLGRANSDMMTETGKPILINSSYRSTDKQQQLYNELKPKGARVATPGRSYHEKGLAIDVGNWKEAEPYLRKYGLVNDLGDDKGHFSFGETNRGITRQSIFSQLRQALGPSEAQAAVPQRAGSNEPISPAAVSEEVAWDEPTAAPKPPTLMADSRTPPANDLLSVQGVDTQNAVIQSAIPPNAPAWAKANPPLYWKVVDAVKAAETPGDIAALLAGGKIGATAGGAAGTIAPGPGNVIGGLVGGVAGAGLAYAAKQYGMDTVKQYLGMQEPYALSEGAIKAPGRVAEGAAMEMIGGVGGKVLPKVVEAGGSIVRPVLGGLSGTGAAAVEEAVKSGEATGLTRNPFKSMTDFDRAMRGQITGEEVVQNARTALNVIKDTRAAEYQSNLAQITQNKQPIDLTSLKQRADILLKRFVRTGNDGNPDWSRSALGPEGGEGVKKIKEIHEMLKTWGNKQGDNTPMGLDMLKRQLDDFYSESSNARAYVASLRDEVRQTITNAVPKYAEMTKKYAEATRLIKDVEAGLMMRKQGMTGRIVADQTLRRLTSAMRDNFQLRKELVRALSEGGGEDLTGQIAGNAMSSIVPRGLAGTGPALLGGGALALYVSPKFWGVLAASSPRVQGEFLRVYGKGLAELRGTATGLGKVAGYEAADKSIMDKD